MRILNVKNSEQHKQRENIFMTMGRVNGGLCTIVIDRAGQKLIMCPKSSSTNKVSTLQSIHVLIN